MKKGETVIEVLIRFLGGEEGGAPMPLSSKKGDDGKVVLESYGIPIAEMGEGEVVVRNVGKDDMTPVRRKHRKWLEVIALEKGIKVTYQE